MGGRECLCQLPNDTQVWKSRGNADSWVLFTLAPRNSRPVPETGQVVAGDWALLPQATAKGGQEEGGAWEGGGQGGKTLLPIAG